MLRFQSSSKYHLPFNNKYNPWTSFFPNSEDFDFEKQIPYNSNQIAYEVTGEAREGIVNFAVDRSIGSLKRGMLGSPNIRPGAGGTMPASRSLGDILIKLTRILWSSGHESCVWLARKLSFHPQFSSV